MDKELTFKAVFLGVLMAVVLGSANAYLGMKAGLTVSATFPAAVVAMAALRPFRGTILEENIARTAASVGEALVAGAIFTIPAFVLAGAWEELHYWESTLIMLIGGVLGVLFIIVLRRTLVVESDLPFPESVAAAEIHKAGQGGQTGARFVFGAMGLGALWELFKNSNGLHVVADSASRFFRFSRSSIRLGEEEISYRDGVRSVARLVRAPLPAAEQQSSVRLVASPTGALDDLEAQATQQIPPGPGEVTIAVEAAGLNFRDVLNALAMRSDPEPLGSECGGTIVAVGEGVEGLSIGDEVIAIAGGAPTVGDSPTPFAPMGWCGDGVMVCPVSHLGDSTAVGRR